MDWGFPLNVDVLGHCQSGHLPHLMNGHTVEGTMANGRIKRIVTLIVNTLSGIHG